MEVLAGLPNWAIYAIIGGVIGAGLAGLGALLQRAGMAAARFLPVLTLAVTVPIGDRLVQPLLEPYRFCSIAQEAAHNTPLGTRLDAVTVFSEMHVDCAAKSVVYDMQIAAASTDLTDQAAWSQVSAEFTTFQCEHPAWRRFLDAGWSISNDYMFTDGLRKRLYAVCI